MKKARVAAWCGAAVVVAATGLDSRDPLTMQVVPAVARAPALVTVRVTVEPEADNRVLQVTAESGDFFRSSEIKLDGTNAPPMNVFEFRNLPTGVYHVTGVLLGAHGPRATVSKVARITPALGSTR